MSYNTFEPTGYGLETFKERYAIHPTETWDEACRRIASFIASAENGHRPIWEDRFYEELITNRFIPGGRILYGAGRAKSAMINCFVIGGEDIDSREGWGKYLNQMLIISGLGGGVGLNCISGDTLVQTDSGLFSARELAGKRVNVLTKNGVYEPAVWKNYGKQQLYSVVFEDGDSILCTKDHEWEVIQSKGKRKRVPTILLEGKTVPVVSLKNFTYDEEQYLVGVQHGLVFGDGTIRKDRDYSYVCQFGENRNLIQRFFERHSNRYSSNWKDGYATFSSALPSEYKQLPDYKKMSQSYLRGFLAGLIASDGNVANDLNVEVFNENPEVLKKVRLIAAACGIATHPVRILTGDTNFKKNRRLARLSFHKTAFLTETSFDEKLIIKDLHRNSAKNGIPSRKKTSTKRVLKVTKTPLFTDVFCCVEPNTHTFVIESGILTGNCSGIRPRGTSIHGIGGEATGAVSYMQLINSVGEVIRGGGGRRSALMLCLNIDHPDIEEFIDKKFINLDHIDEMSAAELSEFVTEKMLVFDKHFHATLKEAWESDTSLSKRVIKMFLKVFLEKNLNNANVSVVFNEDPEIFFDKVRNNADHELVWKGQVVRKIKAKKLWNKIVKNAMKGGEPGLLNFYLANKASNISSVGTIASTNPCGEIPMTTSEVCCLGQLVLPRFVDNRGVIDYAQLANSTHVGVRFLDNVLDINTYPLEEIRMKAGSTRRIGLGITGLHDMLLKCGVQYSSEEGRDLAAKVMKFISNKSYEASVMLGIERGVYSAYSPADIKKSEFIKTLKPSIRYLVYEKGLRNCAVNSIAPCGTNSIVSGVSSGVEPIIGYAYERTAWRGDTKETKVVVHELFRQFVAEGRDVSHFEQSEEISAEDHFKMQMCLQKHVDNAISKTLLLGKGYKESDYSEDVMKYLPYVKGITVYPIGSRGESPIMPLPRKEAIEAAKALNHGTELDSEEAGNILDMSCPKGVCELG